MPSREPTADVLTEQEVGHFHAFGYVVLRAALSPQEVVELRSAYDRVVAGEAAEVRDPGADIVARKAIREIVAQIGERPGWGSFIFSEQTLADGSPALTRMAERYEEIGVTTARRSLATPAA
jgi:hypothetical protein